MISKLLIAIKENRFYILLAFLFILLDSISKIIVNINIFIEYTNKLDGMFKIMLSYNDATLNIGIFQHPAILIAFIVSLDLAIILFMKPKLIKYMAVFAFAGLVNIYEKLFLGKVVDFLYFEPVNHVFRFITGKQTQYIVFNLADLFIFISILLYVVYLIHNVWLSFKSTENTKKANA